MKAKSMQSAAITKPTGRLLVVDDHAQSRESISDILRRAGHRVECVSSAIEALEFTARSAYDVIVTDLQMPSMSGLELIRELSQRRYPAQIVMVTAFASVSSAVEAMRHGAFDYLEKPLDVDRLENLVERALRHAQSALSPTPVKCDAADAAMIGSSTAMQALRVRIARAAPTNETILITGESGVGKELVARAIHAASSRASKPLVSLNCPALSPQLMESELFGHERGAYTGADAARIGRFETASGGTILLDEVTEIDLPLQAKLLRVLQERTFERVGSSETRTVDTRVIATTNRDLRAEVSAGRFRNDLFYRLAVIPLEVPPLRERRGDIPELATHFLKAAADRLSQAPCELRADAERLLCEHSWPGNVRELENLITRASVLSTDGGISADTLRPWLMDLIDNPQASHAAPAIGVSLQEMERKLIEATLQQYSGHRARTAQALGIGLRTLSGKLREYGYAPRERNFAQTE